MIEEEAGVEYLGDLLRQARTSVGLSLREAAKLAGTGVANLSEMETGKRRNPTIRTAGKLSSTYGIPIYRIVRASLHSIEEVKREHRESVLGGAGQSAQPDEPAGAPDGASLQGAPVEGAGQATQGSRG